MFCRFRYRLRVLFLGLTVVAVTGSLWTAHAYLPPPEPEAWLAQHGLETDEASLLAYLREGVPQDVTVSTYQGDRVNWRWQVYHYAAEAMANMKSSDAVPVLVDLIGTPLPAALDVDLDRFVATMHSRQDPEESKRYELYGFRASCARYLGQLGDPAAIDPLIAYAQKLVPELKHVGDRLYPTCSEALRATCVSLGELGSKASVALLMEALPDVPIENAWATRALHVITGQKFGAAWGRPARVNAAARKEWRAWWEQNEAAFTPDPAAVIKRANPSPEPPAMTTVRDYVLEAPKRAFSGQPALRGSGPEAAAWLEKNGPSHLDDLADLVNDPDELLTVRREAMEWYARFGGDKALDDLTRYVRSEVPFDPEDGFLRSGLQKQAFLVIKEHSSDRIYRLSKEAIDKAYSISGYWTFGEIEAQDPDEAYALAKKHLLSDDKYVSAASVSVLMKRPEGIEIAAKAYEDLDDFAKREVITSLGSLPEPHAKALLFEAVQCKVEMVAFEAAQAIQKFELEEELPKDAAKAFHDWEAYWKR